MRSFKLMLLFSIIALIAAMAPAQAAPPTHKAKQVAVACGPHGCVAGHPYGYHRGPYGRPYGPHYQRPYGEPYYRPYGERPYGAPPYGGGCAWVAGVRVCH